jgi:Ca-activated chloride channel family protein
MSFGSPYSLLWLLALVPLVFAYVVRDRGRARLAARWGRPALLPNLVDRAPAWRRHVPVTILLVALAALIVGVARPHATVSVPREEATVLLAIDTSRSMGASDVRPTRLAAAVVAAYRFVKLVPAKYRVGVVAFGSRAQVAVAPTYDRDLVRQALQSLRVGDGTALGDAVALAVRLGRQQRTSDGVVPPISVLLLSDGKRDGGRLAPLVAARRARAYHVPVYTVSLGTADGVVRRKLQGGYTEIIRVPPSPGTLQLIASTTGGRFFRATTATELKQVYERLGSRIGHKRVSREISDLFAAGGGVLLLTGAGIAAAWFRRVA